MQRSGTSIVHLLAVLAACAAGLFGSCGVAIADPLLPDLIPFENGPPTNYMNDGYTVTTTVPNQVLYRFSQPIANIGEGALELRETTDPSFVQNIWQRFYDDSGGPITEEHLGTFPNAHPPYGHMYLVGIAEYRLRTVTSGNGVGPVVASYLKTSYGLYDYYQYNLSLEGAPPSPQYRGQNQYLGISVGWADLYPDYLPGQYIDVTDVPTGQYWLEVEVDPNGLIVESNDANNLTRVLVDLNAPGDFNNDGAVDGADYVVWRKTLNRSVPRGSGADSDGDGVVELTDLNPWRVDFGSGSEAGGGQTTVPEPAAAAMLFCVSACGAFIRRRR